MTNKLIYIFIVSCFLIGCSQTDKKIQAERIAKFENHFGAEKTNLLNDIVEIFDRKVQEKYNCSSNLEDCYLLFLEDVKNQNDVSSIYNLSDKERTKLKLRIDSCGLRKDIWLYGFEPEFTNAFADSSLSENENDTIESLGSLSELDLEEEIYPVDWTDSMKFEYSSMLDSAVTFNIYGNFLTSLEQVQFNDSLLIEYIEIQKVAGGISPTLLANGLLYGIDKYGLDEYFLKRIVVAEFFVLYLDK